MYGKIPFRDWMMSFRQEQPGSQSHQSSPVSPKSSSGRRTQFCIATKDQGGQSFPRESDVVLAEPPEAIPPVWNPPQTPYRFLNDPSCNQTQPFLISGTAQFVATRKAVETRTACPSFASDFTAPRRLGSVAIESRLGSFEGRIHKRRAIRCPDENDPCEGNVKKKRRRGLTQLRTCNLFIPN